MRKFELLELLAKCQEECAPIKLTIGCKVDGVVNSDFIILHECPQLVLNELQSRNYHYSLHGDGLWIDTRF